MFPRLVPMLRERMSINEQTAWAARDVISTGLRRVNEATQKSGYLVGSRFGVADLTAGALLFPLYFPPQLRFELPAQPSDAMQAWLGRWRGSPGEV